MEGSIVSNFALAMGRRALPPPARPSTPPSYPLSSMVWHFRHRNESSPFRPFVLVKAPMKLGSSSPKPVCVRGRSTGVGTARQPGRGGAAESANAFLSNSTAKAVKSAAVHCPSLTFHRLTLAFTVLPWPFTAFSGPSTDFQCLTVRGGGSSLESAGQPRQPSDRRGWARRQSRVPRHRSRTWAGASWRRRSGCARRRSGSRNGFGTATGSP